ncbi:hypothetical protein [Streptococcus ovis]|uniref:hypothetical protein n=1 Tax=Streptococcus ovis TaxID=82806 RepID=UPI0003642E53|nr:hypothetical protein [Streptococcus ovis]
MTEVDGIMDDSELYSRKSRAGGRRQRRPERVRDEWNEGFKESLLPTRFVPALFWSLLVSLLSVANPLLTGLATNLQTQNLYAGFAMAKGQSPYADFFGTSGLLYYLLTNVSYFFQTPIGIAIFQFIALFIAGIYFYKIMAYFSKSKDSATQLLVWFYLFILAAGFGGIYASLFALPFMLTSIWFLIRYFENAVRDEAFIFYGMDAALVFMIYPKSALLWVVSVLVLFIFNMQHQRIARGIYQLLATVFGFLLVIYSVGYYAFVEQILGLAIQQTFFYNVSLDFTHQDILWTALIVLGALVVSGFLKNFIQSILSLKEAFHRYITVTILLAFLLQLVFIVGNANFELSQLIILLPYGFVMAVLPLKKVKMMGEEDEELSLSSFDNFDYLKASFFLPLVACLLIPLHPVIYYLEEGAVHQERAAIAAYIRENSDKDAKIYAWDDSAQVYLKSERLSAATILAAAPYLNTEDNQANLVYDLNRNEAQYIVVNQDIPLLDSVKENLETSYQTVDTGTSHLILYQKK